MGMIHEKMIKIMNETGHISKDNKNAIQKFSFRGIDDVYNSLHSIFSNNGVFLTSEVMDEKREERKSKNGGLLLWSLMDVKITFHAEDGTSVYSVMRGEAMDSGDKASNKAMSMALKYALLQAFLIPTKEQKDGDYDTPYPEPKNQIKQPGNYDGAVSAINNAKNGIELDNISKTLDIRSWQKGEIEKLKVILVEKIKSWQTETSVAVDKIVNAVDGEEVG